MGNYLPDQLYANGFNRDQFMEFIPEIESQCPLIDMKGDVDYRRVGTEKSRIFFHPINNETKRQFDELFENMVGNQVEQNEVIAIAQEKRGITVPACGIDACGAKVAKFSFNDLCVKNLGRADYCTLAEHFNTIFIEGVPKFKQELGTEFKRFVSLTDILYGKKVAVYVQTEVHTDMLFEDGLNPSDMDIDEMMAFNRCCSMLAEMQNPKYHHMVWLMRNHMLQKTALHL